MATDLQIPYVSQALTVNGGSNGLITVATTAGFRRGAKITLFSTLVSGVELVIDDIVSATQLAVRDPSKIGTLRFNASTYLLADTATVVQPEQPDYYTRQWGWF